MLNFILENSFFYYTIMVLLFIAFFSTLIVYLKNQKNDFQNFTKLDKIAKTKIIIIIASIIIHLIIVTIKWKLLTQIAIFILIPAFLICKNIYDVYTNKNGLSTDDKYSRLWAMYLYMIFFSSTAVTIYYEHLAFLGHCAKEWLLIFYLLLKIILFVFFTLNSMAILLSNINKVKLLKFKNDIIFHKICDYDFFLYRKFNSQLCFCIDILIYFILSIITIIFNLLIYLFKKIWIRIIKKSTINIINSINSFISNYNLIIKRITNISIIVAFCIVQIIVISNPSIFSSITKEIYSFISTVILIPFIYDSIK